MYYIFLQVRIINVSKCDFWKKLNFIHQVSQSEILLLLINLIKKYNLLFHWRTYKGFALKLVQKVGVNLPEMRR